MKGKLRWRNWEIYKCIAGNIGSYILRCRLRRSKGRGSCSTVSRIFFSFVLFYYPYFQSAPLIAVITARLSHFASRLSHLDTRLSHFDIRLSHLDTRLSHWIPVCLICISVCLICISVCCICIPVCCICIPVYFICIPVYFIAKSPYSSFSSSCGFMTPHFS